MRRGEPLLGTFVKSPDAGISEVVASAGFDFLVADLEHSSLGLADLEQVVRAAGVWRVPVLVRLPADRLPDAGRALETGATGILISNVSEPATVTEAHRLAAYPPAGERGLALSHRVAAFGRTPIDEYLEQAARELVVVAQIESAAGVDALPALLRADLPVDAWFIGPLDLSASLGRPGQLAHPDVSSVLYGAATEIVAHGSRLGMFARDAGEAHDWANRGATLIAVGSDYTLLAEQSSTIVRAWRDSLASAEPASKLAPTTTEEGDR